MEAAADAKMEYEQEPPAAQYAQCRRLFCGRPGKGTVFGVTFSIASAYGEAGVVSCVHVRAGSAASLWRWEPGCWHRC